MVLQLKKLGLNFGLAEKAACILTSQQFLFGRSTVDLLSRPNQSRRPNFEAAREAFEVSSANSTHGTLDLQITHSALNSCVICLHSALTSMLRLQMGSRTFLLTVLAACLAASCHGLPKMTEEVVPEVPDPH